MGKVLILPGQLHGRLRGHVLCCPYLTVGVGIGTAHYLALVLKNQDRGDIVAGTEFGGFPGPGGENGIDLRQAEFRKTEVVAWRKAHHPADAPFRFRNQQVIGVVPCFVASSWREGRKVVVKDEDALVSRIPVAPRPTVTGAKIAMGIVWWPDGLDGTLLEPLPGAVVAIRTDKDILAREKVETAMGAVAKHQASSRVPFVSRQR
jgi:hypothetical protein